MSNDQIEKEVFTFKNAFKMSQKNEILKSPNSIQKEMKKGEKHSPDLSPSKMTASKKQFPPKNVTYIPPIGENVEIKHAMVGVNKNIKEFDKLLWKHLKKSEEDLTNNYKSKMYLMQTQIQELKERTHSNIFINKIKEEMQIICKEIQWFKEESIKLETQCSTIETDLKRVTVENKVLEDEIKFLLEQNGISQRNHELLTQRTNDLSNSKLINSNSQDKLKELEKNIPNESTSIILPPILSSKRFKSIVRNSEMYGFHEPPKLKIPDKFDEICEKYEKSIKIFQDKIQKSKNKFGSSVIYKKRVRPLTDVEAYFRNSILKVKDKIINRKMEHSTSMRIEGKDSSLITKSQIRGQISKFELPKLYSSTNLIKLNDYTDTDKISVLEDFFSNELVRKFIFTLLFENPVEISQN